MKHSAKSYLRSSIYGSLCRDPHGAFYRVLCKELFIRDPPWSIPCNPMQGALENNPSQTAHGAFYKVLCKEFFIREPPHGAFYKGPCKKLCTRSPL